MKFIPENKTIKTILSSYPIIRIPNFQRDYSWDRHYYDMFFRDIVKGVTRVDGILRASEYFIGTMVFSGSINSDYSIDVIDGQQRLTVITILLSAITDKFLELKENKLADATFKYIKTENDYGEQIPKLKSNSSYPYFETYIQAYAKQTSSNPRTEEEENIKKTYEYFKVELEESNLKSKYNFDQNTSFKELLLVIRDQILQMNVISILTEEKDAAYEIFEILNAKGKSLASIDLIKNIILAQFHADVNSVDTAIEEKWEKIKKTLRSREPNIGFATFFRHYWLSQYAKTTNVKLYDSFKSKIEPTKEAYTKFVEDLETAADTYMQIVTPRIDDYSNRKECSWLVQSLKSIEETFGVSQARIVLLALLQLKSAKKITPKALKSAILYIENFIFAYSTILKSQANIYETRFSNLAINLRKSKDSHETNAMLKEYLYDGFADRFPSRDEFVRAFVQLQFSKSKLASNTAAKYALNKISSHFDKEEVFSTQSSIEHIVNEDISDEKTLSIGNLICLEGKLNNDASNMSMQQKLNIYKQSKYSQVRNFVQEYSNVDDREFRDNRIDERAKALAEYYYDCILKSEK